MNECTNVELMCQQCDPFLPDRIVLREDATLVAVIGPSANPRGYTGITGQYAVIINNPNIINFCQS